MWTEGWPRASRVELHFTDDRMRLDGRMAMARAPLCDQVGFQPCQLWEACANLCAHWEPDGGKPGLHGCSWRP